MQRASAGKRALDISLRFEEMSLTAVPDKLVTLQAYCDGTSL